MINAPKVEIDYTNWEGERSKRVIIPIGVQYTSNQWHPEPQWLLIATDVEKREQRTFAMKDIHAWKNL